MSRLQLEPYLNRVVLVSTIPVGKKKHDYFLHHQVEIIALRQDDTTVDMGKLLLRDINYDNITLDHIWIAPSVIKSGNILNTFTKLFDKAFTNDRLHFLAKVEKYTRNDGSTDYGFTTVSKLEKFVYQLLIPEYVLHYHFCCTPQFGKVHRLYKQHLTNAPLSIEILFERYRDYTVKLLNELRKYKDDVEHLVDIQDSNKYFSSQFEQDKYCAFSVVDCILDRVKTICDHMNYWYKKNEKKLAKKENKRKYKEKVKSRAKGFGVNNVGVIEKN